MITSCKNINITDPEIILPWVTDCIMRHKKRHDFRHLLVRAGKLPERQYYAGLESGDYAAWQPAIRKVAEEAARRIAAHDLRLRPVRIRERVDRSSGKTRQIGDEEAMQQVFDHIAVGAADPIWRRRFVPQQASSLRGRGPVYGSNIIRDWIQQDNRAARWTYAHKRKYSRKCRYFAKLDVQKCYPSLRTAVFMRYFRRDCGNADLLWLWEALLESHKVGDNEGFMIGALVSQFACQYLLSFAYRYVMDLHKSRRGKRYKLVTHALFYMDDQLLFSASRRDLKSAVRALIRYERDELGLTIKPTWAIQDMDKHPVDMMGYRHYSNGAVTIRPRILRRARRVTLHVLRRQHLALEQARRICAYKGYFKHTNSRRIIKALRLRKLFTKAAATISRHDRRNQNGRNGILQRRTGANPVYGPA
ncbi:MAG: hypothetical protein LIO95_10775 [Clostridiales bacterium]|nr:hypothetical protein [Clostridiales bacterium]